MCMQSAVLHQDPAVDYGGADVAAADGVHQVGDRVIHGGQVRFAGVDDDDVGPLAGLEAAGDAVQPQRPGAVDGGHAQHGGGVHHRGIQTAGLVQLGGGVHLGEQIQVVVAGAAVGAQAHADAAARASSGTGADAGGQFHVALRVVGHLDVVRASSSAISSSLSTTQ